MGAAHAHQPNGSLYGNGSGTSPNATKRFDKGRFVLTRCLSADRYLALAGGTMPFIRRYTTI